MPGVLTLDGARGEGGGQILRTALTLAAATGTPFRLERIRAGRARPGLAAQHLTAVRALAGVCGAVVEGASLGSTELAFRPGGPPRAGAHAFDVAEARPGGSAGAATLVVQAMLPALAPAPGTSRVGGRGGTHVPWSPPFEHLARVWLPAVRLSARLSLARLGFHPVGGGMIEAEIAGGESPPRLQNDERGELRAVSGAAVAAELPAHIPQRMANRARSLLAARGVEADIRTERARAPSPGAYLWLEARYEHATAGFSALGRPGKPSETLAEEAVAAFVKHHESGAAVDEHTADQLLVPLALADGESSFTAARATSHLETNAWVVESFGIARVALESCAAGVRVRVAPRA